MSSDPGKVLSSEVIPNVQPAWIEEEYTLVEEARFWMQNQKMFSCGGRLKLSELIIFLQVVRRYPPFIKAMKKRGIDVAKVLTCLAVLARPFLFTVIFLVFLR